MPMLTINGQEQQLDVPNDMPLLLGIGYVVGLTGTKFGCGIALCGACTVHLDGRPIRSCITPVANVVGKKITTVEAIGETESGAKIQRAWLNVEVVQCGVLSMGLRSCLPPLYSQKTEIPTTPKLMPPCPATFVGAAPIREFVPQ